MDEARPVVVLEGDLPPQRRGTTYLTYHVNRDPIRRQEARPIDDP